MQFTQNQEFSVVACDRCRATGSATVGNCVVCRGAGRLTAWNNEFLYWNWPVSNYQLALRQGKSILTTIRIMGGLIFAFGFIGLFIATVYRLDAFALMFTWDFWYNRSFPGKTFLWVGLVSLGYVWYRLIMLSKPAVVLPHYDEITDTPSTTPGDWKLIAAAKKTRRRDVASMCTQATKLIIDTAFRAAVAEKAEVVSPKHLFLAMIDKSMVGNMFIRLGVAPQTLKARVLSLSKPEAPVQTEPRLAPETEQIIFNAYAIAAQTNDSHVRESEILLATVRAWPALQEILYDLDIDSVKLENVVAWVRIREKLRENYLSLRKASSHRDKHGIDRAMTAVATPFLNSLSEDITLRAQLGHLEPCVARDEVLDEIFRIIEGGQQSVVLVGLPGVGKMSIIEGIAQRMVEDQVPDRLKDKRLVQISTSALLAGTTVSGAQQRINQIMNELARARNIILVVNNITDLIGETEGSGMNVAQTLAEHLSGGQFLTIATASTDGYHRHVASSELSSVFAKVEIPLMVENQVIQVLESKAGYFEYKHQVFFSYDALAAAVKFALRFLHDQNVPESAIALLSESASLAHAKHSTQSLVTANDVAAVISQKTGIPATSITEDESTKLLRLEEAMHTRVVGQSEAVTMVASALRRARAEIRSKNRPIANFLFLGPTGVGKTELAKTIADVYFGSEERMIRVDMSEYQDKSSLYRLIGQPGEKGSGLLTEAVREKPFSLVLLDELEKADPNILNLFLSVFDDGRLTDSVGRVIDFTNTIIIATSNAGTSYIQDAVRAGTTTVTIREQLLRKELKNYYRPEFLNRFDGVIVFTPLTRDEIKQVAGFMLKRVAKDLETRGVELRVEDAALEALAEVGFDPEFGARPMRRAIQERVEDQLAELVLTGKLARRTVVILGAGAKIRIENPT